MALVVLLRGVNVGGNKTFRPKLLAEQLKAFGVVNIGAAGTFVVRKPGQRAKFLAALKKKLPVQCEVMTCDGAELLAIESKHPFEDAPPGVVRFVSVLTEPAARGAASFPVWLPAEAEWLVRLIGCGGQFVFGEYRRHMKTARYLGEADKLFKARATTRNWNTILAIVKVLKDG